MNSWLSWLVQQSWLHANGGLVWMQVVIDSYFVCIYRYDLALNLPHFVQHTQFNAHWRLVWMQVVVDTYFVYRYVAMHLHLILAVSAVRTPRDGKQSCMHTWIDNAKICQENTYGTALWIQIIDAHILSIFCTVSNSAYRQQADRQYSANVVYSYVGFAQACINYYFLPISYPCESRSIREEKWE